METLSRFENSIVGKILIVIIPTIITYVGLINIKGTMIEEYILNHKTLVATILFMLFVIVILWIWELFKNKIIALKKFRDAEAIFLTNRFNEAISALSEAKGISNEYDTKADEVYQTFSKSISEYNEAFKSWGIGEYGIGDNTTAKKRN
jgi:hypothetical protein